VFDPRIDQLLAMMLRSLTGIHTDIRIHIDTRWYSALGIDVLNDSQLRLTVSREISYFTVFYSVSYGVHISVVIVQVKTSPLCSVARNKFG
jgi:hypothetical protein